VGDAAACVSLLAGEGCGLGMAEAYVLAGEIVAAEGDHRAAFQRYEQRLRPFIEEKQKSARRFASFFAPTTRLGIWLRNQGTRLFNLPLLGVAMVKREFRDDLTLPEYPYGEA
jgi:2-polyprenyl-6-methoxyphenol hydroxylase-like FAD-dependent oxidoreductase